MRAIAQAATTSSLDWLLWLEAKRGITPETAAAFGLSQEGDELGIPYPYGTKYRGIKDGTRYYRWGEGSKQSLYGPFELHDTPVDTAFLVEGETDTWRLWQEVGDKADVFGIPGINSWRSEWSEQLAQYSTILVILDNDPDYNVRATVDQVWLKIRRDLGPRAKRVKLDAAQVKDVCEFFQAGHTLDDLRKLVMRPQSKYRALDFSAIRTPRPRSWLVEGLIGQGDVTLMFGDPGVGKSWLSMSLALACIRGDETWLGLPVHKHGRVLYIDEENPEEVVYDRLRKLGLTPGGAQGFRYLHEQGVRIDTEPDALLEEAQAFDPTLIVLDSLTRIHTENENDAGAVARMFNDGIKPLARQTGATVLLLHHSRKPSGDASSFARARGSGDITAATDSGLDIRQLAAGHLSVVPFRSRRGLPGRPITVRITDNEDGGVSLVTNADVPPPF